MIIIITVTIAVLFNLFMCIFGSKSKVYDRVVSGALATIFGVVLLFCGIGVINTQYDNLVTINEYQALKQVIETQRQEDYSALERVQIHQNLVDMNNTIASHKVYAYSYWTNVWYSKKVADLPYLK